MAIYDRREYTTRTIEYSVPDGTYATEFNKAWISAAAEYRRITGLSADAEMPAEWVRVYALDDGVVLRITIEAKP